MIAKRAAPSTIAATKIIAVRSSPEASGWRAIDSIADFPIFDKPKAAPITTNAALKTAAVFPIAAPTAT